MIHNEGTFESENGEQIYYQSWLPLDDPRAVLLLVHGLAEHSSRYEEFAEFFTAARFAVYTLDQPGHGQSGGMRGHIKKFSEFTNATIQCLEIIKKTHSDIPRILVGHSMGGLIAASLLIAKQSEFIATVLTGPAIKTPDQPSRLAILINRMIAALFPKFGVLQLDSSAVSRDPEEVRKYDNDPLVFRGKVTARLAAELFSEMDTVLKTAAAIRLPTLILHGGSDSLTDVDGSKMLHDRISSGDKKIVVYDRLFHEIFNEPERIAVMTDMREWLDDQLLRGAT